MKILVLGVGNTLLSDEGIGIHTLNYLRRHYSQLIPESGVEYVDGGTLSFTLLPLLEDAENLIIIDAAQLQATAGTVHCFLNEDMDIFLNSAKRNSVHEVNLIDLLAMLRLTERLPARRALIAIQPSQLEWGDAPTPKVALAIPSAAEMVVSLIQAWM
jgi:hydrogenase maturation protease